jgi:hypothetical protein
MDKVKIKLLTIGHLPLHLNLSRTSTWKSDVFELSGEIENFVLRGNSDSEDWIFSDALLKDQLPAHNGADFLIAIVNVPIETTGTQGGLAITKLFLRLVKSKSFLTMKTYHLKTPSFGFYTHTRCFTDVREIEFPTLMKRQALPTMKHVDAFLT